LFAPESCGTTVAMSRTKRFRAVLLGLLVLLPLPAGAVDAPYEDRLYRLGEVLGSLHYLRNLCGETGSLWREQMEALVAAEDPSPEKRKRLIASFNRGYRSNSEIHMNCTRAVTAAIERYMKEGEQLTRETAVTFGN
jgi:uncharacterized protein (TIGR02301 family)